MSDKVWYNGYDWYIAASAEEAQQMCIDRTGMDPEEAEGEGWVQLPDDRPLSIVDADLVLGNAYSENEESRSVVKTAAEWVAVMPRGLLCSAEY